MDIPDKIKDRRAWTAATIDERAAWMTQLSAESLDELERVIPELDDATDSPVVVAELPCCAAQLAPLRQELERGRGFALVEGLDEERFGRDGATSAYWALGQLLGRPFEQNVEGALLYDVRDTGSSVTGGARFSVTSAGSTFHTDNAFNASVCCASAQLAKGGAASSSAPVQSTTNSLSKGQTSRLCTVVTGSTVAGSMAPMNRQSPNVSSTHGMAQSCRCATWPTTSRSASNVPASS